MSDTSTRWSANVISDAAEQLWYFIDGRPITQRLLETLDILCPEEHQLLAAAGRYALSCRSVLARHRRGRHAFEVIATAQKCPSVAGQPSHVALTCIFDSGISPEEAEQVGAEARPSNAVSDALAEPAAVSYQVRILHQPLRGFELSCAARADEPLQIPYTVPGLAH